MCNGEFDKHGSNAQQNKLHAPLLQFDANFAGVFINFINQGCCFFLSNGTGVTFAPKRGSHSPLNQKGSHSPLNHNILNMLLNLLGSNLGTRGHLGGTGEPLGGTWGHMVPLSLYSICYSTF